MKILHKTAYLLIFMMVVVQTATSQILKSVYFFDNNPTRHEFNPAFATNNGYIGVPLLGNIGFGTQSSLALSSILYPTNNGGLTTFLDSNIHGSDFLSRIKERNNLEGRLNLSIFSTGFHKWGGFNTAALNLKVNSRSTLPYDLFALAKSGMTSGMNYYNLKNTRHTTDAYAEIAFGHSREISKELRIGVKAKILLGAASMTSNFTNFDATLSQDNWTINSNGTFESTGVTLTSDETGKITGVNDLKPGVNGAGLAFDLGVSYQISNEINISASLLDIGFIVWNKTTKATTSGTPFIFNGFNNITISDKTNYNSLNNQLNNLKSDLKELYSFYQAKTGAKSTRTLPTTLVVGAEHTFFNKKLTTGLLSTTGFSKEFIWTDLMATVKYTPINWFSFSLNGAYSNLGWNYGTFINFTTSGFNFFAGVNTMTLRFTPQAVPIGRASIYGNIGFNVMLKHNEKQDRWK